MSVIRRIIFFLMVFLTAQFACGAELWETLPETGNPTRDFAGMMTGADCARLDAMLRDFHDHTGASLVVVTVPSLQGAPIEDFSNKLFNRWGVGDKATNRGVLLVVAKADRKMRIECGYGAEGVVPDAIAKRIIAEDITPAFKAGRLTDGIFAGVRSIMARFGYAAPGAPPPMSPPTPHPVAQVGDGGNGSVVGILCFCGFIVLLVVSRIFRAIVWGIIKLLFNGCRMGNSGGGWSSGSPSSGGSSSGGGDSGCSGGSSGGGGASGDW